MGRERNPKPPGPDLASSTAIAGSTRCRCRSPATLLVLLHGVDPRHGCCPDRRVRERTSPPAPSRQWGRPPSPRRGAWMPPGPDLASSTAIARSTRCRRSPGTGEEGWYALEAAALPSHSSPQPPPSSSPHPPPQHTERKNRATEREGPACVGLKRIIREKTVVLQSSLLL